MFEHKTDPLLPRFAFLMRLRNSLFVSIAILIVSLGFGSAGYHYFGGLPWVDALLNASMILTGMGPVDAMATTAGKLFSAFYALYSGIAFLTLMAVLLAPFLHRLMHKFHLEEEDSP